MFTMCWIDQLRSSGLPGRPGPLREVLQGLQRPANLLVVGALGLLADIGIPVEDVLAAPQKVAGLPWVHGLPEEREAALTSFILLLRRRSHLQLQF